jgi:hypothetical protein
LDHVTAFFEDLSLGARRKDGVEAEGTAIRNFQGCSIYDVQDLIVTLSPLLLAEVAHTAADAHLSLDVLDGMVDSAPALFCFLHLCPCKTKVPGGANALQETSFDCKKARHCCLGVIQACSVSDGKPQVHSHMMTMIIFRLAILLLRKSCACVPSLCPQLGVLALVLGFALGTQLAGAFFLNGAEVVV